MSERCIWSQVFVFVVWECLLMWVIHRDVAHISSCDDGCMALAGLLGWKVNKAAHTQTDVILQCITILSLNICLWGVALLFQAELEEMVKLEHGLIDSKDSKKKEKEFKQSSESTGVDTGKWARRQQYKSEHVERMCHVSIFLLSYYDSHLAIYIRVDSNTCYWNSLETSKSSDGNIDATLFCRSSAWVFRTWVSKIAECFTCNIYKVIHIMPHSFYRKQLYTQHKQQTHGVHLCVLAWAFD